MARLSSRDDGRPAYLRRIIINCEHVDAHFSPPGSGPDGAWPRVDKIPRVYRRGSGGRALCADVTPAGAAAESDERGTDGRWSAEGPGGPGPSTIVTEISVFWILSVDFTVIVFVFCFWGTDVLEKENWWGERGHDERERTDTVRARHEERAVGKQ